jgi:hypothetical protein
MSGRDDHRSGSVSSFAGQSFDSALRVFLNHLIRENVYVLPSFVTMFNVQHY